MKERHYLKTKRVGLSVTHNIIIGCVVLMLFVLTTGSTFSRMTSSASGSSSILIAKPVISLERSSYTDAVGEGNTGSYCFYIENYKAIVGRNEVSLTYKITPSVNDEYLGAVVFRLYKSDSTFTAKTEITISGGIFTDGDMTFGFSADQTHYYILEYTPDTEDDITISVDVTATQVD